jgi:hypothetical protein
MTQTALVACDNDLPASYQAVEGNVYLNARRNLATLVQGGPG